MHDHCWNLNIYKSYDGPIIVGSKIASASIDFVLSKGYIKIKCQIIYNTCMHFLLLNSKNLIIYIK